MSFAEIFGSRKLESLGYRVELLEPGVILQPTFSRFSRTPTCDRQTDRQTYNYCIYTALAWRRAVKTRLFVQPCSRRQTRLRFQLT